MCDFPQSSNRDDEFHLREPAMQPKNMWDSRYSVQFWWLSGWEKGNKGGWWFQVADPGSLPSLPSAPRSLQPQSFRICCGRIWFPQGTPKLLSLQCITIFYKLFPPSFKKKKIQGGVHCWISLWSFKFQLFLSRIFAFLDLKVEFSTHVMEHGPSHNALNLCLRPMLLSLVSLDCVLHVSQIKETVVLFIVCLFGCFFSSPLFFFGFFFPLFFVLILFLKLRRLWKGFI